LGYYFRVCNVDLGVGLEEAALIPQGGCKITTILVGRQFSHLPFMARDTLAFSMKGDRTGTFVRVTVTKLPL
jgi:hypothetical protein